MSVERSDSVDLPKPISSLTQHAILHACIALSPVGIKLPGSGTHRIEQFCNEILTTIQQSSKSSKKKKPVQLVEQNLLPEVEILKFYEGVCSSKDFAQVICEHVSQHMSGGERVENNIHKICWNVYSECQKFNITYPKWLTPDSTFNLWLVFCSVNIALSEYIDSETMNEFLMRVYKLSSYSWTEGHDILPSQVFDFPLFLEYLTKCFASLDLHPSVVTEILFDLTDEIVHGVLRKGYLEKKGHKAPTIKRRWFVLTRSSLVYYTSRDKLIVKGRLVLNPSTSIAVLADKPGGRKHRFCVTCGKSGTDYEFYADDDKSRNEWILDIEKAIQLENALQQNSEDDILQAMGHFFRLRYGTASPVLPARGDSIVGRAIQSCPPTVRARIQRFASTSGHSSLTQSSVVSPRFTGFEGVGVCRSYTVGTGSIHDYKQDSSVGNSSILEEAYETMDGTGDNKDDIELKSSDSENEEDGYTFMFRGGKEHNKEDLPIKTCADDTVEQYEKGKTPIEKRMSADLHYDEVETFPKYVSKKKSCVEFNQDTPLAEHDSKKLEDEPEIKKSPEHYIKLGGSDPTGVQEPLMKSQIDEQQPECSHSGSGKMPVPLPRPPETLTNSRSVSTVGEPQTVSNGGSGKTPVPPPRPPETLTNSRSVSTVGEPQTVSKFNSSPKHTVENVHSPMRHQPTLHSPVPPPRPLETMTGNTVILPPVIRESLPSALDEDNIGQKSPVTPPPVPSRSIISLDQQESSPIHLRHPPYVEKQNRTSEHELYYVLPNDPSLR